MERRLKKQDGQEELQQQVGLQLDFLEVLTQPRRPVKQQAHRQARDHKQHGVGHLQPLGQESHAAGDHQNGNKGYAHRRVLYFVVTDGANPTKGALFHQAKSQ